MRSIYYRRPNQFRLAEGMSGPEKAFAYGEARRGFGGVLQALDGCLWVNDPVAAARCEYKPVQLAAAVASGLDIPETLITNDPGRAHQWATVLGKPIIYKPMSGGWPAGAGTPRVLYTSPVPDPADLLDPALAQTEPSGRFRFLETNQCGEWGWLAAETGLPVAAALADVLEKGGASS